jgi:hypothetical protein
MLFGRHCQAAVFEAFAGEFIRDDDAEFAAHGAFAAP